MLEALLGLGLLALVIWLLPELILETLFEGILEGLRVFWRHVRTGFRAVDAEVWAWLRFFGGSLLWLLGFFGLIVLVFYLLR